MKRRTFRTLDFDATALGGKDLQAAIDIVAAGMVEAQEAALAEQPAEDAGKETATKERVPGV